MNIYEKIENARKVLGLDEEATINELKKAYREKAKLYHPDNCSTKDCEEKMKELNLAYDLLLHYCENYKISFRKEEIIKRGDGIEYEEFVTQRFKEWFGL